MIDCHFPFPLGLDLAGVHLACAAMSLTQLL